jgi:hypothetical protein
LSLACCPDSIGMEENAEKGGEYMTIKIQENKIDIEIFQIFFRLIVQGGLGVERQNIFGISIYTRDGYNAY